MSVALLKWLWPYAVALLVGFGAAWWFRGVLAENAMAAYVGDQDKKRQDHQELTAKVEAAGVENRKESSNRLDVTEQAREVEVQYVDREIIKYVTKYRDVDCPADPVRSIEWVCLYNRSLGLPCSVPETGAAG